MVFRPPWCPNPACEQHLRPAPAFYQRRGTYAPRCRPGGVPRVRCKTCGRSFSRQTFRHDYQDRRPADNLPLFLLLASGMGLREAGRLLGMDVRAVWQKRQKMATTFGLVQGRL